MAHILNDFFGRLEGKKPIRCNDKCEYYKFPHLPCACVLSEVFSVNKNEFCYTFKDKESC